MSRFMSGDNSKKLVFPADIASGLRGCHFAISACLDSIRYNNRYNKVKFPFWAFASNGEFGREWILEDEYRQETERVIKMVKRPGGLKFFSDRLRNSLREGEKLRIDLLDLLPRLKKLNQEQLIKEYDKFVKKYTHYFGLGVLTFVYESFLSEKFLALLVKNGRPVEILDTVLRNNHRSFMLKSEDELYSIGHEKNKLKRDRLIKKYLTDFYYIQADYYQAPVINRRYLLGRIKNPAAVKQLPDKKIKIKLNSEEKTLARLLQLTGSLRDCRKKINLIGLYGLFRFLDEVSRRRLMPLKLARRAFWFEYSDLITQPAEMIKILKHRKIANFVYNAGHLYYLDYQALTERRAVASQSKLSGVPASAGLKTGKIKLIFSRMDFCKLKKGDILAATMTRPEFVSIMKKAGAIITEEGGITSHAAIVARELKIPCIVGLKNMTRILHDGDLVEVDADKGIVKIIKKK